MDFQSNCSFRDGGETHPLRSIRMGKPKSQFLMAKNLLLRIGHVKGSGETTKEYYRKFKTFGFMDTHNSHRTGRCSTGKAETALFHCR